MGSQANKITPLHHNYNHRFHYYQPNASSDKHEQISLVRRLRRTKRRLLLEHMNSVKQYTMAPYPSLEKNIEQSSCNAHEDEKLGTHVFDSIEFHPNRVVNSAVAYDHEKDGVCQKTDCGN